MKISISVIIITYKSRSFIAGCLNSLRRASKENGVDITVIDNASGDGIGKFLEQEFPEVNFCQNERNIGFGAACNQGAKLASSNFLVFLNPDTIVSQRFFNVMLIASQELADVGILSGTLYDGCGNLLPESARRLPTIVSAIKKAIGRSSGNIQYYETINAEEFQKIPIVSAAAMMIQKTKFERIGGFDERFFMYAEDIDLSYRAEQCGYSNYLIKNASVIHLKGESTSKEGWGYNRYFYATMATFVHKYKSSLYSNYQYLIVFIATLFLGALSMGYHWIARSRVGISDFLIGIITCFAVQFSWSYMRYGVLDYFGYWDHLGSYILYVGVWVVAMVIGGAYWRDRSRLTTLKSLFFGILISLVLYSLVSLDWRFSRVVVLSSGLIMLVIKYFKTGLVIKNNPGRIIYVNDNDEEMGLGNINSIIRTGNKIEVVKSTNLILDGLSLKDHLFIKTDDTYDPVELVLKLGSELKYSFVNSKTRQIVSSHFSGQRGDKYDHLSHHNLSKERFIYQKRLIDIITCLMTFWPLVLFQLVKCQKIKLEHWIEVFKGDKTIVGYEELKASADHAILSSYLIPCYTKSDRLAIRQEKMLHYSLHYSIFDDCYYILMHWRRLFTTLTYGRIEK
ncbi:MAG: GT2 family glycosyltransferase [Saprospiraceae bacterium]|jgi:GT2 family glycosyltransferase